MKRKIKSSKNIIIKTLTFFIMSIFIMTALMPITQIGLSEETNNQNDYLNILCNTINNDIYINYEILNYDVETIQIDQTNYTRYTIPDESNLKIAGDPDIPNIRRSIIIPDDKKMKISIKDISYTEIDNVHIIPSKGILPKTINPNDIPYKFNDIYGEDVWYPESFAELEPAYIMRDYRGQIVHVNLIQYNPFLQKIRLVNNIEVVVTENGEGGVNVFERTEPVSVISEDFKNIYQHHFLNYDDVVGNTKYTPVSEIGNMLVITYDDFYDEMLPLVEWKNMKGVPTEMVNMSVVGSTETDVDNYIENYYNTNGLTFVLLVGDIAQIPSLTYSGHASDPSYAYIVGSDNYQDIFVGRISAQTADQVITQVERCVEYEKYPLAGGDWYHKAIGVASDQGTGDDGEYDDEHIENIRGKLLNFTYTEVEQSYDPWGTTSIIANAIDAGLSIANYCGHGSPTSWGNGGGFSNSDVNALVNDNMLPYIVSVACNNGEFENYDTCFAEAWLRATNNGEPTGAIGCFASTQSQSWDPPMDAQDEINDLFIAGAMYSLGGLSFSGTMHMMDEYGSSCYDETNTWTYFGDPSTQLRTDTPATMTVNHDSAVLSGSSEFEVEVAGVEGALCALSSNAELIGFAYTDSSGIATIMFADDALDDVETVDLVVTSFNKMTYLTTLDVTPPLRNIPEFDPMQGVLINYGGNDAFGISYEIIAEMSEDVVVTTIVDSSSQQSTVESLYAANGVNTANCDYLIAPSDTYWTRDYGPWFRFNNTLGEVEIVDFEYNRPRPNDDDIPNVLASQMGLNAVFMDIVHAGGNYMTDGLGYSVSTELVLSENPSMSETDIQELVQEFLGVKTYELYPDPLGEYIEHVDCWAKLLSAGTMMVIEVDPGNSNYADIEAAAAYFASQTSSLGTPFEVVRVYCDVDEPYINSLILNDKVLVPVTGSSYDADALAAYEAAMPGYEVLGFTGSWQVTDALHCRVKGIVDVDMVGFDHDELVDQMPDDAGFEVVADMVAYGVNNSVVDPMVYWKNSSVGVWQSVGMSADEDTYTGVIPNHPCGETIFYYLSAENGASDVFFDPFIGGFDPFSFDITLVPDIWVDPLSIDLWGNEGQLITDVLTIGNDPFAGENLDFNISCSDVGGYGWLSVDTFNGSIVPDSSINVSVIANTTGLPIGYYEESLTISSDDPDTPFITIPVTVDVVYGDNVGSVSVNYPTGTVSYGTYTVNATVQNFGSNSQTDVLVNCSIFEGGIGGDILYEDFSTDPTDWNITNIVGTAWTWDSNDQRMENSYSGSPQGYLDSPVLDCSGKSGINLSFWHDWRADYSGSTQDGYVRGSIDGGQTFPYLIDEFHHNDPATDTGVKTYDISSWANNQPNVMIRFDITNNYDWHWYIDDFNVTAEITGPMVYSSETLVDIPVYDTSYVEFLPPWDAVTGTYGIQITTLLSNDENTANDITATVLNVEGPALSFDPGSHDFGTILVDTTDSTTFDIWNSGVGTLTYSLSESESWLDISPTSGDSTGEHDTITINIDTTGLTPGQTYHADISITSDGGNDVFAIDMYVVSDVTPLLDVNQSVNDRGFPIRHAADGDWAGAQDFLPGMGSIAKVDLYLRKFGTPEFDLVVELREGSIDGTLLDTVVFTPAEVSTAWEYLEVDFADTPVTPSTQYFIVCPPAPSGVTTSFGYEWGYAFGDLYTYGSFWFTRDSGNLWRDLPSMYEFTFKTYGLL